MLSTDFQSAPLPKDLSQRRIPGADDGESRGQ